MRRPAKVHRRTTRWSSYEIESDGRVVWVNSDSGECVGRFSAKGVDVHRSIEDQMRGESQCLDCCHGLPFDEMWARFLASMRQFYAVEIDPVHRPLALPGGRSA